MGLVMGAGVAVFGLVYQVNLALAGVFQGRGERPGVKAFPLEGIVLLVGFVVASSVLLARRRA